MICLFLTLHKFAYSLWNKNFHKLRIFFLLSSEMFYVMTPPPLYKFAYRKIIIDIEYLFLLLIKVELDIWYAL